VEYWPSPDKAGWLFSNKLLLLHCTFLSTCHVITLLLLLHVQLPSVDSVEYWRSPDKAGWLQSQSEVMKMWRRRWFVLKQGYLFRFLSPDVSGEQVYGCVVQQ
jgi:hypothetical protein